MTNEEVAVRLENHEQEIKSLKHRMREQEEQGKIIQELVLSVQKLGINMEAMIREQTKQGEKLDKMESEPANNWNTAKRTVLTAVISTIAGGCAVALIMLIAQYL